MKYKKASMQFKECVKTGIAFNEYCHLCGHEIVMCRKYSGQCNSGKCREKRGLQPSKRKLACEVLKENQETLFSKLLAAVPDRVKLQVGLENWVDHRVWGFIEALSEVIKEDKKEHSGSGRGTQYTRNDVRDLIEEFIEKAKERMRSD